MDWISVKDRFPEIDEEEFKDVGDAYSNTVWVTDGKQLGFATRWKWKEGEIWSTSYYIGSNIYFDDITHWMELPQPPIQAEQ